MSQWGTLSAGGLATSRDSMSAWVTGASTMTSCATKGLRTSSCLERRITHRRFRVTVRVPSQRKYLLLGGHGLERHRHWHADLPEWLALTPHRICIERVMNDLVVVPNLVEDENLAVEI